MCMSEDSEMVTMIGEDHHKARKPHKCAECCRTIQVGERYLCERFHFDSEFKVHKTCQHCEVARDWLRAECGGHVFGAVAEDIQEHTSNDYYGFGLIRLNAGLSVQWLRRDGRLWPVPKPPLTTHQRMEGATNG